MSCYFSPNRSERELEKYLARTGMMIREHQRQNRTVIVGGDFNAKNGRWGSPEDDSRGVNHVLFGTKVIIRID